MFGSVPWDRIGPQQREIVETFRTKGALVPVRPVVSSVVKCLGDIKEDLLNTGRCVYFVGPEELRGMLQNRFRQSRGHFAFLFPF